MIRVGVSADNKADLIAWDSAVDGQAYFVMGNSAEGDSTPRFYYYNASSTATSDGENVLDANGMSNVGRYIKTGQIPSASKRQERYSGTTSGSGTYAVTFATAYSVAPNIQANIIGGGNSDIIKITSVSTTGFTVTVVRRSDVIGLLPTYASLNGASVDVLISEK